MSLILTLYRCTLMSSLESLILSQNLKNGVGLLGMSLRARALGSIILKEKLSIAWSP